MQQRGRKPSDRSSDRKRGGSSEGRSGSYSDRKRGDSEDRSSKFYDRKRGGSSEGRSGSYSDRKRGDSFEDRSNKFHDRKKSASSASRSGSSEGYKVKNSERRSEKSYDTDRPKRGDRFNKNSWKPSDKKPEKSKEDVDGIRLNKYIAHAGICSRREADDLIKSGAVTVNKQIVVEMGFKVKDTDIVNVDGTSIRPERKSYVLLNKPKGFITTTDDPQNRRTVMALVESACKERIYPVGRLDRNTSGLLLFTNDGDLAKKLMHPSHNVKKIYHATLDKKITHKELQQILEGVELEDGFVKADEISFVGDGIDKTQVGIALHSGKNRVVRRIFAHLGYDVVKLDRVFFAGLTKRDLPRGRYRHLSEKELGFLMML